MRTARLAVLAFVLGFGLAVLIFFQVRFLYVAIYHGGVF